MAKAKAVVKAKTKKSNEEDVYKAIVRSVVGEAIKKDECAGKKIGEGLRCLEGEE